MEISKLARRSSYEEITEQIKNQIRNGNILPGDKLPSTKELAEKFAVGRSTMREALSALKAMGLIDIRQGEGCTVRQITTSEWDIQLDTLRMSRETILELIEARKSVEVSNAALAAEKRTEEDLLAFDAIIQQMSQELGDEQAGEKADLAFHLTLAKATHNSVLVHLFESISDTMETAIRDTRRHYMYADKDVSVQLLREHKAIYAAIAAGDAEKAGETMKSHLFHVERVLTKFLK